MKRWSKGEQHTGDGRHKTICSWWIDSISTFWMSTQTRYTFPSGDDDPLHHFQSPLLLPSLISCLLFSVLAQIFVDQYQSVSFREDKTCHLTGQLPHICAHLWSVMVVMVLLMRSCSSLSSCTSSSFSSPMMHHYAYSRLSSHRASSRTTSHNCTSSLAIPATVASANPNCKAHQTISAINQ